MSIITSVLTGGSNSHQTTSEEANATYTDFVSEGIVGTIGNTSGVAPATGGFAVNAQGSPDMTVAVSAGVAYVTGTPTSQNSQTFRVKNSASANVTISANSSGSTKYDWVYIKLDATNLNTPNTAGDDVATLVVSRSSSAASDDGTPPTYGYPLAVVTVANGASSISNGNIRDIRTQVALNTGTSNATDGWTSIPVALTTATGYNKGNKEYDLTSSSSLVSVLTPGMRMKITRAVTPPTQCTDLESGSSQFASKSSPSGVTFTDDFSLEAWIKLESYGSTMNIVSRYDGTTGFALQLNGSGQVLVLGIGTAGAVDSGTSYQSIPIGTWVHVAATLDMSGTTAAIYINGVSVPTLYTNGGQAALIQAGSLQIGAANSLNFFDGKVADVRIWSAVRTATQIRDNMNQQLVGNETNLVGYYKLDGNFTDSTSNANNMTGSGGAVATDTDNPMNATEYAIVTKVTASTVTVFTGTDWNIPNITLSTPYYSSMKVPFGFNAQNDKWCVTTIGRISGIQSSPSLNTWYNAGVLNLSIPTGAWRVGQVATIDGQKSATTAVDVYGTLSTANNTESNPEFTTFSYVSGASGDLETLQTLSRFPRLPFSLSSQTIYYLNVKTGQSSASRVATRGDVASSVISAECAYI
jgi:hypothetical protein